VSIGVALLPSPVKIIQVGVCGVPDMIFSDEGLRAGGDAAAFAGGIAEGAVAALLAAACPPAAVFGRVTGTEMLAAAVGRARDGHARVGAAVADGLRDTARRAAATAAQGGGLVSQTTAIARSAPTPQP
jgi:hypothetical protein